MAKPKDPSKPSSENAPERAPLELIIDAIATATGQLKGLEGADLTKHVTEITDAVRRVTESAQRDLAVEDQKQAAGVEVQRMVEVIARTGTAAGGAIAKNREAISRAFQGVDLAKVADGLRVLAEWLQKPESANEAQVKAMMERLQSTMGPMVGYDPKREDEERRAQIKSDVQKSLDEIFRGKKKDP